MGLAYYVETEGELRDLDPVDYMDGVLLAEADESIFPEAYEELSITPLSEFFGAMPANFLDEAEACTEDAWFDADEGLQTVQSLISYLQDNPELARDNGLMEDLKGMEDILMACADESVRWRLAMDV